MADLLQAGGRHDHDALVKLLQQVAIAANEANTLEEATQAALDAVCAYTGWPVGHAYFPSPDAPGELWPSSLWHLDDLERFRAFQEVSGRTPLAQGIGLPGRVWATGEPVWSPDVTQEANFPRAKLAHDIGVKAGFAFPVHLRQEMVAVLEFFTEEAAPPDRRLLEMMAHLGTLLGRVEERRSAREALRASEERYRTLSETAIDAIITAEGTSDGKGIICDWNKGAQMLFGYRRAEVLGQPLTLLMPARYLDRHRQGMMRVHTTGETHIIGHTVELHGLRKDGQEFPLELSLTQWKVGGKTYYTGIIRDITARKRSEDEIRRLNAVLERRVGERTAALEAKAKDLERQIAKQERTEEALREREAQFRMLAEAMPQIVWTARADGVVDYYNQRWTEFIGQVQKQSNQWHWQPVVHPEDEQATRRAWTQAVQTGQPYEIEHRIRRADGTFCWMLSRAVPLVSMSSEGRVIQWLGTTTDIHGQKQVEKELRRAKEAAEAANRAKSDFLANMSHEIRTPLTAIIGFASLLASQVSGKHQETVRRIEGAGHRLMETLGALLTLARLEAHAEAPATEVLTLAKEAEEVVQIFQRQAQKKGLAFAFRVEPGAEGLRSRLDRGALTSILQNLISNAIKFTERGSVAVSVGADREQVHLHVVDTGIGIRESFMPHLFEPFQQASTGQRRSHEGSGLGLSITKQLAERMEGALAVESEEGVGTRFTVSFPIAEGPTESGLPGRSTPDASEAEGRLRSVLVVEDSEDTRILLQHLLEHVGEIAAVSNAEEALREAQRRRYDLVLLDINLGHGRSGTEVLQELRAMGPYREVPMAALTAYALPGDREHFLAAGFDAYLSKPFTVEELLELTSQLLVQP